MGQPEGEKPPVGEETPPEGFPDNTPVGAMTVEQQANYWKFRAGAHERRANGLAAQTAEAQKWKADSDKLKEFEAANASEQEKAITAARSETETRVRAEEQAKTATVLVRAEIKAAAAGKLNAEQIKSLTENMNPAAFIDSSTGQPDEAKIVSFVEQLSPKGAGGSNNPFGQGTTEQLPPPNRLAEGAKIAAEMFPPRQERIIP